MLFTGKGRTGCGREEDMPNQDGTGPLGQGPMTGGGFGPCGAGSGYGAARSGSRRGRGFFRFGRSPQVLSTNPDQQRIAALEREVAELKRLLRGELK